MVLIVAVLLLLFVYFAINLVALVIRNRRAHKFFATKSPKLPVLPNPHPIAGHVLSVLYPNKNWKIIQNLHEKYGPTFGYYMCDQPWVSTKDLDLIKLIELDEGQKHINRTTMNMPFEQWGTSLFEIKDDRWRRVRRTFAPAYSNHMVRGEQMTSDIESIVVQLTEAMRRRIEKSPDRMSFEYDAMFMSQQYVLAAIFLLQYRQSNLVDFNDDQDKWTVQMSTVAREILNPLVYAHMGLPFLRPVLAFLIKFNSSSRLLAQIVGFIREATNASRLVRERSATQTRPTKSAAANPDLLKTNRASLDIVIDGFLDGKLTQEDFVSSLSSFLLAAYATTSDTIACLMWQLARNPEIQEKMRKAILEDGIDADYVVWCIHEAIRFHPGAQLGIGRMLGEDVNVNGRFLAKGTYVMITTHGIHHDPKIWPEPERFRPERWRDRAQFHPAQFMGFGLGPRNCPGGQMAVHEIKILMRMILGAYRLETCDQTPDEWRFSSPGLFWTLNDDPITLRFVSLAPSQT